MAKTKSDAFDLTGLAAGEIRRAGAAPAKKPAPDGLPARARKDKPAVSGTSRSVYLYTYQDDALVELEYRARKRGAKAEPLSSLLRAALDEYLVKHGAELGLTGKEVKELGARASR